MKAIPPSRKASVGDALIRGWSFGYLRILLLCVAYSLMGGVSQRSWSQNPATNGDEHEANATIEHGTASPPIHEPTTIRLLDSHIETSKTGKIQLPTSAAPVRDQNPAATNQPAFLAATPHAGTDTMSNVPPVCDIVLPAPLQREESVGNQLVIPPQKAGIPQAADSLKTTRLFEPQISRGVEIRIMTPREIERNSMAPIAPLESAPLHLAPKTTHADAPTAQMQPAKEPPLLAELPESPRPRVAAEPRLAQAKKVATMQTESMPTMLPDTLPAPTTNSSFLPANPENYCFRCGVQCPSGCNPGGPDWQASRPIPWEVFAQGEYIGPARLAHVPVYRLRVDDRLSFVYRLSGQVAGQPYRLNVRDRIQVQSLNAPEVINREVIIQPDGTITLPLLGQVRAAGATMDELGRQLNEQFKRNNVKDPQITVTPLVLNSNLDELRASVDRRYGQGGQVSDARVSPDGTVQLPAIGSVPAQGLTLEELEREVKARYARIVEGLEVTPTLLERAPRFIYVVGEVRLPGRFTMEGPTTLMQAIALAGSWNVGAQLQDVVVFRRDENWQLMATKVNIRSSLLFKQPCPAGEIWLRDSDIVLVPKSRILCADDVIELVFTRGIYGVFPLSAQINFSKLSSL